MEKGLNSRNSHSKTHKLYKRTRASLSSLDETVLKNYQAYQTSCDKNPLCTPKYSSMRNTFNDFKYSTKTQQIQSTKHKEKRINRSLKRSSLKDSIQKQHRYSACNLTSAVTPSKKSKRSSVLKIEEKQQQNELSKYKFIYQIGFGGFGKVWKVIKRNTYKQYAMKEINKKKVIQKDNVESIMNQRCILSSLKHPFLINMHSSFQNQQNLYLTMDYLRGADLRYHICYKNKFTEQEIKFIVACILVGLQYIHQKGIIHRDIKPQNIVFQQTGYIRLTDFGIAKAESSSNLPLKFESSGTPGYMAPQILCKMPYSFSSDFFAIGVIVYELIIGHRPYDGKNRQQIRENILTHQAYISQEQLPKGFSKNVLSFVNGLLQRNPQERLGHRGFQQLKNHKWLKDIKWKSLERKEIVPSFKPHVICETKQYLDEIVLYSQMRNHNQNVSTPISPSDQLKFIGYDFHKIQRPKMKIHKNKHTAQNSVSILKSKPTLNKQKSLFNLTSHLFNPKSTKNNFFKKNRRHSQQKIIY